jgi:maleylacetoacetate isomerase/maleylpyruvate isomerase
MELQLYNYFRSSAAYRVRIALNLKGLSYEYKPVHLLNNGGEQNSPEYLKINPSREVPALVHEGQCIGQSVAIIEYLDEMFKVPSLYPLETANRARVRQLCEIINCTHPLQNLKVLKHLESEFGADQNRKNKWVAHWMHQGFQAYEEIARVTSKKFSLGDQVTAADLFLIPQMFSAKRFQVDTSGYSNLSRINENCLMLEAFRKAHPHRQIDTPAELREN